mgnify:CR=1 FL=1
MSETFSRWCKLAGLLTEQTNRPEPEARMAKKDLYVFDFDDTLGVTTSPTLVAAVEYSGGDPNDSTSYTPIKDLKSRIGNVVKGLQTPAQAGVNSPGISGNVVRSNDKLDDAEAVVLDTEQYRDWKEKYIPSGDNVRLVINPNIENDIMRAGKSMFDRGVTGEIHVTDFSPSSTIGSNVRPINPVLDILSKANAAGDETAVVTARKGETDLDSLGGGKIPATNAADIEDFVAHEAGTAPDIVIGAADYNPADPASAKRDLVIALYDQQIDNIHFYDDDPENARKVAEICGEAGDEGMDGVELSIYNYEFAKGGGGNKPTLQCTVGDESDAGQVSEANLRKIIRSIIKEGLRENKLASLHGRRRSR